MTAPTRGLDMSHYCQFGITPIFRAVLTPGEEVLPEAYYDQTQQHIIGGAPAAIYDFVFTGYPIALADVQVTVSARSCFNVCPHGVVLAWDAFSISPPSPIWAYRPWTCEQGCDDEDPLCSPDDCSDNSIVLTIPKEVWNTNFTGTIGSLVSLPQSPNICDCSPDDMYLSLRVRFLSRDAVQAPDDYVDDLTFEPYHGFATHHTAICGNVEGILSKALGEWRIDPHDGRMICAHEWAPADDSSNIRYAQGGLTGIHYRPEDEDDPDDLGELSHGVILHQHIEGMLLRIWTDSDGVPI